MNTLIPYYRKSSKFLLLDSENLQTSGSELFCGRLEKSESTEDRIKALLVLLCLLIMFD